MEQKIAMTEACMRFACTQMARGMPRTETARMIADSPEWEDIRNGLTGDEAYTQIRRQIRFADKNAGAEFRPTKYGDLWEIERSALQAATTTALKETVDGLLARLEASMNRRDGLREALEEKLALWLNSESTATEVGSAMQIINTVSKLDNESITAHVELTKLLQDISKGENDNDIPALSA